jgi:hypothetical protein
MNNVIPLRPMTPEQLADATGDSRAVLVALRETPERRLSWAEILLECATCIFAVAAVCALTVLL